MSTWIENMKRIRYTKIKFKGWYVFLPLLIIWLISLYLSTTGFFDPKLSYKESPIKDIKVSFDKAQSAQEVEQIYADYLKVFSPLTAGVDSPTFVNQVSVEAWVQHKKVVEKGLDKLEDMANGKSSQIYAKLSQINRIIGNETLTFQLDPTYGTKTTIVPYFMGNYKIESEDDIQRYFDFLTDSARMYKELVERVKVQMALPEFTQGVVLYDVAENHQLQKQTMQIMDAMEMSLGVFASKLGDMGKTKDEIQVYMDQLIMIVGSDLYVNARELHDLYMEIDRHSTFIAQ